MKDKSKADAVVVSFVVAFVTLFFVYLALSTANPPTGAHGPPPLDIRIEKVSQDSNFYDVALSILNVGPTLENITSIQIHGTNALTHINATEIADPNQMNYGLSAGSTLQVNLRTPISDIQPNETAGITVSSTRAMFYQEIQVP